MRGMPERVVGADMEREAATNLVLLDVKAQGLKKPMQLHDYLPMYLSRGLLA